MTAPSQMAAGKYRSCGGKVSLFTLLLAAYSSRVVMTGTGCIFQEPDSSAVGVFPQNPRNFPFDTLRLKDLEFPFSEATNGKERLSFQQNTFTHMFLAHLSAYYPKLWLFLPLAVTCLVRHTWHAQDAAI